ncbi:MAG: 3-keto-disaccharide hydrolase, partial [Chitinophagaceae bacterium]
MKNFFLTLLISTAVLNATTQAEINIQESKKPKQPKETINTLSKKEKADGWQLLFDGSTKNGWHIWHSKSDGSAWKVEDGTITLDASKKQNWQTLGGGDLVTDESFENYHFSIEWKISPKGNSGIIFCVNEDDKYEHTWHTGMEMQVVDNEGHPDGKIFKHQAGDLYD